MAKYYLTCRANGTGLVVAPGIETDFEQFNCVLRLNQAATWALTLRRESAFAKYFLPSSVDGGLHNGLIFSVDNEDGQGVQQILAGPQLDVNPKLAQSGMGQILVSGQSNLYWLSKRRAFQTPHYPFIFWATATTHGTGGYAGIEPNWYSLLNPDLPVVFIPMYDTSGTSAANIGSSASAGTYVGGVTLNKPSLLDDPNPSALFNGTSGYVTVPTTGLQTGNGVWTVYVWGMITANPSANACLWSFGTNVSKELVELYLNTSGQPFLFGPGLTAQTGATAVPLNEPFLLALTYDGTTLTGYHYSSTHTGSFGSTITGGLSITYGSARIGNSVWQNAFFPGYLQMAGFANGAFAAATLALMYTIGSSRHQYLDYDTLGYVQASQAMLYYAQRNAGASGGIISAGLAQPATAFTNWQHSYGSRAVPGLAIPTTDPALGSNVFATARQDNLLGLLGALSLQSTPELGFDITESSGTLNFSVFSLRDQSATAVFSLDRGNIVDYDWKYSVPVATHLIAGAQNPSSGSSNLTDRLFGEAEDSTNVSAFGYTEDFIDARKTSTGTGVQSALNGAKSAESVAQINVNATLQDTAALYFMGPGSKGYKLGDQVTVIVDGQTFVEPIRQIAIDLQPGAPAVVTPAIGTPIAAEILQEYSLLVKNQVRQGAQITDLLTNY